MIVVIVVVNKMRGLESLCENLGRFFFMFYVLVLVF